MAIWILLGVAAAVVLALSFYLRRPGFRGAIGFRNEHVAEVAYARARGFSRVVQCPTLKPGEHSFSYAGRQDIPEEASIEWQFITDTKERRATVSLRDVPRQAPGEAVLFFVLGKDGTWHTEYSPRLRFDGPV